MRAITNNNNLFKEAIDAFNKNKPVYLYKNFETSKSKRIYGYLILDFYLSKDIVFDDFIIHKSIQVNLCINRSGQQEKVAFVCPVWMPERVNFISSHLFTLALSAICSFAFERPVLSTRNDDFNNFEIVNDFGLKSIGVEFPTTVIGSNAVKFNVHEDVITLWENRLQEIIYLVDSVLEKNNNAKFTYECIMQSFRLVQLAHLNKKEDFDLGYSFLIAGIESVSQIAIEVSKESKKHLLHNEWKSLSKTNKSIKVLFDEYLRIKTYVDGNLENRDLTKRFGQFILLYNNDSDWEEVLYDEIITDGLNARKMYASEISVRPELTPQNINKEQFEKIIRNTYSFRSKFLHTGLSLPHSKPNNSFNERFFQIILNREKINALYDKKIKEKRIESSNDEWLKTRDVLIKYELMSMMARNSITNYLRELYTR